MSRPGRALATAAGILLAGSLLAGAQAYAQLPAAPDAEPAPPGTVWVQRGGAELQVLDKVNARSTVLKLRDGEQGRYGSLAITVRSCVIHPPDQPADAAAFLVIADSHPGAPAFRGWMFESDPAVSMLQHPIYDVRVMACSS